MVAGGVALLLAITAAVLVAWQRRPHLAVGWLWYLGTFVPMIGLVQVGEQARADRYAYFPLIGIFIVLVWSIPDRPRVPALRAALAVAILGALSVVTWKQVGYWQNSRTLFEHTLALDPDIATAHNNLGLALYDDDPDAAIAQYQEAVRLDPRAVRAYSNLGVAHAGRGETEEAIQAYQKAIALQPDWGALHANLGSAYARDGKIDQALAELREAVRLDPDEPQFRYNLAVVYARRNQHAEAIAELREALRLRPRYAEALIELGDSAKAQGRND